MEIISIIIRRAPWLLPFYLLGTLATLGMFFLWPTVRPIQTQMMYFYLYIAYVLFLLVCSLWVLLVDYAQRMGEEDKRRKGE